MTNKPSSTLSIRVQPRARKDEIAGRRGEALLVRLTAPPVEGAANRALIRFLAQQLGVRPGQITILRGGKSRDKVLQVEGLGADEIERRLGV
jgi:uncharacterized protein (TIGR00251 family)